MSHPKWLIAISFNLHRLQVKYEGFLAQVTINVGGQLVTSIITRDACDALRLKKGVRAFALIKSTEVMVIRG